MVDMIHLLQLISKTGNVFSEADACLHLQDRISKLEEGLGETGKEPIKHKLPLSVTFGRKTKLYESFDISGDDKRYTLFESFNDQPRSLFPRDIETRYLIVPEHTQGDQPKKICFYGVKRSSFVEVPADEMTYVDGIEPSPGRRLQENSFDLYLTRISGAPETGFELEKVTGGVRVDSSLGLIRFGDGEEGRRISRMPQFLATYEKLLNSIHEIVYQRIQEMSQYQAELAHVPEIPEPEVLETTQRNNLEKVFDV